MHTDLPILARYISTERYPCLDIESERSQKMIRVWNAELKATGLCVLESFVNARGVASMVAEAEALAPRAFHNTVVGNAYLEDFDETLPHDHPKRLVDRTTLGVVAYDQIPPESLIRQIYEWPLVMQLVEAIVGRGPLYKYACPLGALNVGVMKDGDYLRWHFDQSDFVVSVPIQEPLSGGVYEYVHNLRSADDPRYDQVGRVLQGDQTGVKVMVAPPGSLVLFEGRNTLHRVTEIKGSRLRLNALFGYALGPDVTSSQYLRQIRYGRET